MLRKLCEEVLRPAIDKSGAVTRKLVRFLTYGLVPSRSYVLHKGSMLPLPYMRMGGSEYQDNDFFLDSAIGEAERVITKLHATSQDVVIDIGCGHGRLAIGLIRRLDALTYRGFDVSKESVDWCKGHIEEQHPSYQFQHLDVVNARYNPSGGQLRRDFCLPLSGGGADIVYMWGVVTNMEPEHLTAYASEMSRLLRRGGRGFLTSHVEEDVPDVSINPENYTPYTCDGPLHCVRYERGYFINVFQRAGLVMTEFVYHGAGNCQSDLYFVKL